MPIRKENDVNSDHHRRVRMMIELDTQFKQLKHEDCVLTLRPNPRTNGPVWISRELRASGEFDAVRWFYKHKDLTEGEYRTSVFREFVREHIPLPVTGYTELQDWIDDLCSLGDTMRLPKEVYFYYVYKELDD
jgi:hypothetical protein